MKKYTVIATVEAKATTDRNCPACGATFCTKKKVTVRASASSLSGSLVPEMQVGLRQVAAEKLPRKVDRTTRWLARSRLARARYGVVCPKCLVLTPDCERSYFGHGVRLGIALFIANPTELAAAVLTGVISLPLSILVIRTLLDAEFDPTSLKDPGTLFFMVFLLLCSGAFVLTSWRIFRRFKTASHATPDQLASAFARTCLQYQNTVRLFDENFCNDLFKNLDIANS